MDDVYVRSENQPFGRRLDQGGSVGRSAIVSCGGNGEPAASSAARRIIALRAALIHSVSAAPACTRASGGGANRTSVAGADVLNDVITIGRSKNGASRQVQMKQVVRSVLFDLATQRERQTIPKSRSSMAPIGQ